VAKLADAPDLGSVAAPPNGIFSSCMCEHWRHKAAISDAHNVNTASTIGFFSTALVDALCFACAAGTHVFVIAGCFRSAPRFVV
jgi:hypothetical protein